MAEERFNLDEDDKDNDITLPSFEGKKKEKKSSSILDTITSGAKSLWDKANTPLVDVSPKTREAMDSFQKEHPVIGGIGNFAVDALTSGSSPASLALEAASAGSLKFPALKNVGRVAGAGALAHGGVNAIQALSQGDYPKAVSSGAEASIGLLGLRGRHGVEPKLSGEMEVAPPRYEPVRKLSLPPSSMESKPDFITTPEGVTAKAPPDINNIFGIPGKNPNPEINPENMIDPNNPNRNVGAGVKTVTRPEGLPPVDAQMPEDLPNPAKAKSPKQATLDWANGRRAASQYGRNVAIDFQNLSDPDLVDKYQSGDRTGKLQEVQDHLDGLRKKEVKAGILPEDANKANYLRQYWEDPPQEVDKVFGDIVAKNPGFSKQSVFKSYRQGIAAGLTPKFTTLPEILEARTAESVRAIKNKEFYDYLNKSGKLKPGVAIPDTQDIDKLTKIFKDPSEPESKELIGYISNYLGDSNKYVKQGADVASLSKNIYLGGGVPGTKYNMHAWNTMKSDAKLRGFGNAIKEFVTDPTGKKAETTWDDKGNRDLLAKLMEHGYTYHPVEDVGGAVRTGLSGAVDTVVKKGQDLFEKPLFEHALPATKFKGAQYALDKLRNSGMSEEDALKQSATIANEFYGGMNKVLRDKTMQDVTRIVALAPDWLESRVRLAAHDWQGTARTLMGKGDAADLMHAKSLGRGAAIGAVGAIGASQLGGKDTKVQDVTNIPTGQDAKGKNRLIDMLSTADEGVRLPIQIPLRAMQGNPMSALDMLGNNKISLPAKSVEHLITGKDEFGNAIRGKDKYGRNISATDSIKKHIGEVAAPFTYQGVQGFVDYMRDNISGEEAASKGLELPLKYEKKSKVR